MCLCMHACMHVCVCVGGGRCASRPERHECAASAVAPRTPASAVGSAPPPKSGGTSGAAAGLLYQPRSRGGATGPRFAPGAFWPRFESGVKVDGLTFSSNRLERVHLVRGARRRHDPATARSEQPRHARNMTPAPLRLLCRVWFGATLAVACLLLGVATRILHLLPISLESSEDLSVSTAAVLFRLMLRVNPQIRVINTVRHVPGCQSKPSGSWKRPLSLRPAKPTGIASRPARRR